MSPPSRRLLLFGHLPTLVLAAGPPSAAAAPAPTQATRGGDLVCLVEYRLETGSLASFERFARALAGVVTRAGGEVLGVYAPDDAAGGAAAALIAFADLADYETCRARLAPSGGGFGALGHGVAAAFIRSERWSFQRRINLAVNG